MNIDDDSEGCYYVSCPSCKDMLLVWKCTFCGYIHPCTEQLPLDEMKGNERGEVEPPPDACPDCGRPKEHFELIEED